MSNVNLLLKEYKSFYDLNKNRIIEQFAKIGLGKIVEAILYKQRFVLNQEVLLKYGYDIKRLYGQIQRNTYHKLSLAWCVKARCENVFRLTSIVPLASQDLTTHINIYIRSDFIKIFPVLELYVFKYLEEGVDLINEYSYLVLSFCCKAGDETTEGEKHFSLGPCPKIFNIANVVREYEYVSNHDIDPRLLP
jgi:hypothetical protein